MLNNFEVGHVVRHTFFLVTFIIAVVAWIIAFVSQCDAEAKYDRVGGVPVVSYLWYSIWIQLAATIHLFLATCTDQLAVHRFQLAIVLVIAQVFAVYGVNFIFDGRGPLVAVGVAWLLIAVVDLLWILYLTSEEETLTYRLFTSGGDGGLSGYSRRVPRRESGAMYGGGELGSADGGLASGYGNGPPRANGGNFNIGGYAPAPTQSTPQKGVTRDEFGNQSPLVSEDHQQTQFKQRARAMYAYSADPSDQNEVSFAKGDMLEVVDGTGKWFQVRTANGQTGIAPSNYLTML